MKKFYILSLFIIALSVNCFAQVWEIYEADETPDLSSFAFSESNVDGDPATNEIIADPSNPANSLLKLVSPGADPSKFMWKYSFPNDVSDPITLVARVKGVPDGYDRTMEFDIQQAGFRERLYIKNDNTFELKQAGVKGDLPGNPLEWHIFRITKNADQVSFYLDENPIPVATVTTGTTSSENYFRFGDGNGSSTLGGFVDWIIWDTTGVYAPGEGLAIPGTLVQDVQSWIIYEADVTPDNFVPAFSQSNVDGDPATNTILADPDNAGNNLLELISPGADPSKFMWKQSFPNDVNDPVTFVARIKGVSDNYDRTMEFDFRQGGFRERLYIKNDNTFELKESGVKGNLPGNPLEWHILRITKSADQVSFYLDENPEAIASVTSTTTDGENYFRFGDGNGSSTLGGFVDWIIWDTTGVYEPGEGLPLPGELVQDVQSWVIYEADVTPDNYDPPFSESNVDGDPATNTILDDPDNTGNTLLELISPGADPSKFMWKHSLPNDINDPITLVARVKGVSDTYDRTMEFDFRQGGFRERLYIKNDNTYELKESGLKDDLPVGTLGWHLFRITKNADQISFYLDENPVAIASVTTATTDGENYIRFGDGNGSSTLGGYIDWMIWDTTGAYAPDVSLVIPEPLITTTTPSDATLIDLAITAGALDPSFASDSLTYDLVVPSGTTSVTLTATATDPSATVEGDGEITTIPSAVVITVTAQDGYILEYTVNISEDVSGVNLTHESALRMYPNPVADVLNLELGNRNAQILIYNVLGERVFEKTEVTDHVKLDLSGFKSGLYIIRVFNAQENISRKFMKK